MKAKENNEPHVPRENNALVSENAVICRSGWLKNGNPPGNPNSAKRCNAKAKRTGEPCRQPAMANGKCRLHGGKSTGPKTSEGLEASRKANWRHGLYSAKEKQERRTQHELFQQIKSLLKSVRERVSNPPDSTM